MCLNPLGKLYITRHMSFNKLEFLYVFLFKSVISPSQTNMFPSNSPTITQMSQTKHNSSWIEACLQDSMLPPPPTSSKISLSGQSPQFIPSETPSPPEIQLDVELSPIAPPTQSNHPKITRSKAGITKPRTFTTSVLKPLKEPKKGE